MSQIAIVGGTSALAKQLIPVLQERNSVVTLGRKGCDLPCDLLQAPEDVIIPRNTDAVVHLAAAFESSTDCEIFRTVETNLNGTLKVCMAAKQANVPHVVIISSIYACLSEFSPHYGIYSITKRQAEELATDYCRRNNILLTLLRPAPIVGTSDAFRRHQPLFYRMADLAEKGEDILIYGKHDALRNYLNADDMAQVILRVLELGCGGLYSCTFPKNTSLGEVALAAMSAFNRGGRVVYLKNEADVRDNVFEFSCALYEKIGFTPSIDVREVMLRIARHRQESRS